MSTCKPLRIVLLGASPDTGNMGVNVLAAGAVKCIFNRYPRAEVSFFDYGKEPSVHMLNGRGIVVPKVNIRFSKKVYLPNNIAFLLLLALFLKWVPSASLRKWIVERNMWLRHIHEADMVLSIAGGDSFSDMYGLVRLLYVSLPQVLAILTGQKLLLLPQTIGPFKGTFSRALARYILRHADRVYARDYHSLDEVANMLGRVRDSDKFCYDVGFILDPVAPSNVDNVGLPAPVKNGVPLVGVNVSGLLFNGGYTHHNMFGLRADYKTLVSDLLEFLINKKGAAVVLIPHVFGTTANSESDWIVCKQIWEELHERYEARLAFLDGTYDQSELKYMIGLCDFFVGSRMHACIAAVSQGVPAVSLAYSDKFVGVMGAIGAEASVADARCLSTQAILDAVDQAFDSRDEIRERLLQTMVGVRSSVLKMFDSEVCGHEEATLVH